MMARREMIKHPVIDKIIETFDQAVLYEGELEGYFGKFLNKPITDELKDQIIEELYDKGHLFKILKHHLPKDFKQIGDEDYLQHNYGISRERLKKLIKGKTFNSGTIENIIAELAPKLVKQHTDPLETKTGDYSAKEGLDKGKELIEGIHYALEGHPGAKIAKESVKDLKEHIQIGAYVPQAVGSLYEGYKKRKRAAGD